MGREKLLKKDNPTVDDFMHALPKKVKNIVKQNDMEELDRLQEQFGFTRNELLDSVVKYSSILEERKTNFKHFINAIIFINFINLGDSKSDAYRKTFPDRLRSKKGELLNADQIAVKANNFYNNDLVQKMIHMLPMTNNILFFNERIKAMRIAVDLMENAYSEKVRIDAVKVVLENTKPPEELNINIKNESRADELLEKLRATAEKQAMLIDKGMNAKKIINVEIENDAE